MTTNPKAENADKNLDEPVATNIAQLWQAYFANKESDEAIAALVKLYIPLVYKILARIAVKLPTHVTHEDLVQVGTLGLYQAITRFDPEQGASFETFAGPRIRGAILDELRSADYVSRHSRALLKKIDSFINEHRQSYKKDPSEKEIAAAIGMTEDSVQALIDKGRPWLSLEDVLVESDGHAVMLQEILADKGATPAEETTRHDLCRHLRQIFRTLAPKEQKILYLYYYEELHLADIAALFELTEARICQIHTMAIAKMKAALNKELVAKPNQPRPAQD